jgi:hypothetical protein
MIVGRGNHTPVKCNFQYQTLTGRASFYSERFFAGGDQIAALLIRQRAAPAEAFIGKKPKKSKKVIDMKSRVRLCSGILSGQCCY